MKTPADFNIQPGHLVQIDLDGEDHPHMYPQEYVVIENTALLVGDDFGMKVASYPYQEYHEQSPGVWKFRSTVGDFILRSGPPE